MTSRGCDALFLGAGLSSLLAAYRLRVVRPELKIRILEKLDRPGGDHTWSFHRADIDDNAWEWVKPLVSRSWQGYEVSFPGLQRTLPGGYFSIDSSSLVSTLGETLQDVIETGVEVDKLGALRAECLFDARGWRSDKNIPCAYQKFVGQRLLFEKPHGRELPLIMDAKVVQEDGYRFVYLLPWSENEILVEDTRYSDTPEVDIPALRQSIAEYCRERRWGGFQVRYEEVGVLPIPLSGNLEAAQNELIPWGTRAGFFQATTGYSFPDAVRYADRLCQMVPWNQKNVAEAAAAWRESHWKNGRFLRGLNRMMFLAAKPHERYRILERFYTLPEPLIERFYAGRLTLSDQARILSGKPPVPIVKALKALGNWNADG